MSEQQTDNGIEEQERLEILEEIDRVIADNRLTSSDESGLKKAKTGAILPLIINILAISAVAATVYFSGRMFEQKKDNLNQLNATYTSAEGKLLEELKKESEQKLSEKDSQINQIQSELSELDRQSRELADTMEQRIADRETELRSALEAELERERQNMRSAGRTEADISAELERIEAARMAEYDAEIQAFRNENEKALEAQRQELEAARRQNEQLLAQVNSEKDQIRQETAARENELTAQYEAEKSALAEEAAAAAAKIEELTRNRERESLVIDQINGSYEQIFNLIRNSSYEQAISAIQSLNEYINDPTLSNLAAVQKRKANDIEILNVLKQRIEEQTYKTSVDNRSRTETAELLLSARELARLGDEALRTGDSSAAADYYSRAVEKLPSISTALSNLESITRQREAERISPALTQAEALENSGSLEKAAQQYVDAAAGAETENPDLFSRALEGLVRSYEKSFSGQLAAKDTAIKNLEAERKSAVAEIQKTLDDTISRYETRITEADSRISELTEARNAELQELTAAREAQVEELTAQRDAEVEQLAAERAAEVEQLTAEQNTEIDRLTRMIGERDQENLKLNSLNVESGEKIAEQEASIEELNLKLTEAASEMTALNESFEAEKVTLEQKAVQAEKSGYTSGYGDGRTEALEDVLTLTGHLAGTASASSAQKINELSSKELLFAQAVREISALAATSDGASSGLTREILVGSVSWASGSRLIIERLSDTRIADGAEIIIRRKERGKSEYLIGTATVISADSGRIEAELSADSEESPRSLDLVYVRE